MARKKPGAKKVTGKVTTRKKRVGRPPTGQKPIAFQMRASAAFKRWLDRVRKADHAVSVTETVTRAIVAYAKSIGVKEEPPER